MLDFIELIGIGGVLKGDKMKLANTSGPDKAFFSNPEMTDVFMEIKGEDIKGFLAQFGKYTEDIKPDVSHVYSYKNAHGAAQIADKDTVHFTGTKPPKKWRIHIEDLIKPKELKNLKEWDDYVLLIHNSDKASIIKKTDCVVVMILIQN